MKTVRFHTTTKTATHHDADSYLDPVHCALPYYDEEHNTASEKTNPTLTQSTVRFHHDEEHSTASA